MGGASFFKERIGVEWEEFRALPRDRAAALVRQGFVDLLHLLGRTWGDGKHREPSQVMKLADSLEQALWQALQPAQRDWQGLRDRVVVDGFTRREYDRDQNVYLGRFFTRFLTRAVPDLVFQPLTHRELEVALEWARREKVKVTTRGAGTTALGGSVPNDGGLLLDMSRFDFVQVDLQAGVAAIGAGARFKDIHRHLADLGLALKTYPSNLGGTLAGWFGAGGYGLNAFKYGSVQGQIRAVSMVLPQGHHVRFHDDGRLDVLWPEEAAQRLTASEGDRWLQDHGYPALRLTDLAGSEGQLGVFLAFSVDVVPAPQFRSFFFEFEERDEALHFLQWVAEASRVHSWMPANLKYLSRAHVEAARCVRGATSRPPRNAVYLDFDVPPQGEAFAMAVETGKWRVGNDEVEARAWFEARFRPQEAKRLGPGFLAAEILLPVPQLKGFLHQAETLARGVGIHLESEVFFLEDGLALVLAGFLTPGPRWGFSWELVFAPLLVELAMSCYDGRPYVLGRWQAPFFCKRFRRGAARQLWRAKKQVDPGWMLNQGVYYRPVLRLPLVSWLFRSGFRFHLSLLRRLYGWSIFAGMVRRLVHRGTTPGRFRRRLEEVHASPSLDDLGVKAQGCANCGECNAVCPVFHDAKLRLPQMLTHVGESLRQEGHLVGTPELLLDLCMRCGNCEQVCQVDIPHRALFAALEERTEAAGAERRERQWTIVNHLRHSEKYLGDFLGVRPGGYIQRTPASLPGEASYLLFRAGPESKVGEACIHCGVCVSVCPTAANLEYEVGEDPRRITTDVAKCIGCGTCVEVCPGNLQNGGRTLRVMEAPGREFFEVLAAFEAEGTRA